MKLDKAMYVVNKGEKYLRFVSLVNLVGILQHSKQCLGVSPLSCLQKSSDVYKKKRKEKALHSRLTEIFLQVVFTHTELRIILLPSKSMKNTSRAMVGKVFWFVVVVFFFPGVTS